MSATTKEVWISVPVPPPANHRLKASVRKTKQGRKYIGLRRTEEASNYQDLVRAICMRDRVRPIDGDLEVTVTWYRDAKRGDVMDRFKDLWDALEGHAYFNDAQIADYRVSRDDSQKDQPRVIVCIRPVRQGKVDGKPPRS